MFDVVDEPVLARLRDDIAGARRHRLLLEILLRGTAAVRQLPQILGRGRVLAMTDHASAIEHQRLQALLGQLFGRPAAADAGADDDRVVESTCLDAILVIPLAPVDARDDSTAKRSVRLKRRVFGDCRTKI